MEGPSQALTLLGLASVWSEKVQTHFAAFIPLSSFPLPYNCLSFRV